MLNGLKIYLAYVFGVLATVGCSHFNHEAPAPATQLTVTEMRDVLDLVMEQSGTTSPNEILVVFDIDDTLLTTPQTLGGVAWFDRQAHFLKTDSVEDGEIGENLFAAQGILFEVSKMNPVETDTVEIVARLNQAGISTHALTARGPAYVGATLRELKRNEISLATGRDCGPPLCDQNRTLEAEYIASELEKTYSAAELEAANFKSGRDAVLLDGVLMVAGQNKGLMLQLLLESFAGAPFEKVFFIDDSERNVSNVIAAAPSMNINLVAVHYTALADENSQTFSTPEKIETINSQWRVMETGICGAVRSAICD